MRGRKFPSMIFLLSNNERLPHFLASLVMSQRRQRRAQLRAIECLAYSSTLSYLRAQNDYDTQAKYIIDHLRPLLHISPHRHLAELKRILNDEELERLVSLKHLGESNLKQKWTELESNEEEEENKSNAPSANSSLTTAAKKRFKAS